VWTLDSVSAESVTVEIKGEVTTATLVTIPDSEQKVEIAPAASHLLDYK